MGAEVLSLATGVGQSARRGFDSGNSFSHRQPEMKRSCSNCCTIASATAACSPLASARPEQLLDAEGGRLRGTFTYIGKVEEVKQQLRCLVQEIGAGGAQRYHWTAPAGRRWSRIPATIGDLYEGEPIVPSQSKQHRFPSRRSCAERPEPFLVDSGLLPSMLRPRTDSRSIGRDKISAPHGRGVQGGTDDRVRQTVLDLALSHHLVSQYTSLVAVDVTPARPTRTPDADRDRATNLARARKQTVLAPAENRNQCASPSTARPVGLLSATLLWKIRGDGRMTPLRPKNPLLSGLMAALLAISLWQVVEGSWIVAKARLAQYLLQRAWIRALSEK